MSRDMRNRMIGITAMAAACILIIAFSFLWRKKKKGTVEEKASGFSMGSMVSVTFYGESDNVSEAARDTIELVQNLDEKLISWREDNSELSRWNREAAAGEGLEVDHMLSEAVEEGIQLYKKSSGVLDLTLRPVLDIWGIEDKTPDTFTVPTEKELTAAGEKCGMDMVSVAGNRIIRNRDVMLDLGSIGKGYALDVIYNQLNIGSTAGIVDGGVVAVGGSVMVFGSKADGGEFRVGIRDPEGLPDDILGYIAFPSGTGKMCISTSGGYEKYIEKDGKRYHHIIDPRTLKPADSDLVSVTAVCENGLYSDGLSTACFILGEEKALKLLKKFGAEAVLIREDGSIYVTEGLRAQVVIR